MNRKKHAKLHQIYRKIPKNNCNGKCQVVCGSVAMSKGEFEQLRKVSGEKPSVIGDRCGYLKDGCTVYEDRPAVCRLYGVTEPMMCEHCEPEKILTEGEARAILDEVSSLFGEARRTFITND